MSGNHQRRHKALNTDYENHKALCKQEDIAYCSLEDDALCTGVCVRVRVCVFVHVSITAWSSPDSVGLNQHHCVMLRVLGHF